MRTRLAGSRWAPRARRSFVRRSAPVREVIGGLAHEWREDRVGGLAAEVAFFAVLSVFPALLALAAALGFLDALLSGEGRAEQAVVSVVAGVVGDEGAVTPAVRRLFDSESRGVLTAGVALAIIALSRGFAAVVRALDVAYDLDERRSWLSVRITAVALSVGTLVVAPLLLAAMVVGPLLGGGMAVANTFGLGQAFATAWTWLRVPAALLVVVSWAATIFHVAPNHHTPWRCDLPGAVLTAAVWIAVSAGFRVYLHLAGATNAVFGVLGGALTLLFWLYLLAIGLLAGGELNALLADRRAVHQAGR